MPEIRDLKSETDLRAPQMEVLRTRMEVLHVDGDFRPAQVPDRAEPASGAHSQEAQRVEAGA